MLRVYDQSKQQLYDNSILHLDKISVGINGNRVLVIESSSEFTVKSPYEQVKLVKLVTIDQVDLFNEMTFPSTGNNFVPVYLNLYSEEELTGYTELHISNTDGDVLTINVKTIFEDNSDRLLTLLNNNGIRISDIWYKAIKTSNIDEISPIVLNSKRREFLLDLLRLTGCIGGYNNMFAALDFFEWSDIVTIYEYWKDGDFGKYRLTDSNNKIMNPQLLNDGFVKTNWLGLYFQLNQPDGTYDADGFANFENINIAIADIWTKLYYLKQILEETFLPTNVKFIDIVGEYTSIAGVDSNVWIDKAVITSVNPNPAAVFDNFSIKGSIKKKIVIEDSYCLRKLPVFIDSEDGDKLKLVNVGTSSHPTEPIFKINKTKKELENYYVKDFEMLTQFYRGDFATIEVDFDIINEGLASTFKYKVGLQKFNTVTSEFDIIYLSDVLNYSEFLQSYKLGIRRTGKFRLAIYVFDGYGAMDMMSDVLTFDVSIDSLNIQLYELSKGNAEAIKYDIGFYTTIPTINHELIVPDAFDNSFDIADRSTAVAGRYYKNHMTDRHLETTINQYNMVENRQLKKARIVDYSTYHEVVLLRFHPSGFTSYRMKLYPRHDYTSVAHDTSTLAGKIFMVSELNYISMNNTDWKNPFNRYTYQLVNYSLDGTLTNVEPVIMAFSKEADRFYDKVLYNMDAMPLETAKLRLLALNHAFIRLEKISAPSGGDLIVTIDKKIYNINVQVDNLTDVFNVLRVFVPELSVTMSPNNMLLISCKSDFSISHTAIGYHYDIVRNVAYKHIKTAKIGQDFQITIPVFASPEKRYNTFDYVWTIYDHYSGDVVHTENNAVLSWLPFNIGIFDVKLEMLDGLNSNAVISSFKRGGIRIADVPFDENGVGITYYNEQQKKVVYSQLCPSPTEPQPYTYIVPERKYFSNFSQEQADDLALDEIADKAQNWVNQFGLCSVNP